MAKSDLSLDEEIESLQQRLATLKQERLRLDAELRKAVRLRRRVDEALKKADVSAAGSWHSLPTDAKRRILERSLRRSAEVAENPSIFEDYVAATLKAVLRTSKSQGTDPELPTPDRTTPQSPRSDE